MALSSNIHAYLYTYTHVHIYTYTHIHLYRVSLKCTHTQMQGMLGAVLAVATAHVWHIHTYTHENIHNTHIYMYTYTRIHIYTYTHIHIYSYTHIIDICAYTHTECDWSAICSGNCICVTHTHIHTWTYTNYTIYIHIYTYSWHTHTHIHIHIHRVWSGQYWQWQLHMQKTARQLLLRAFSRSLLIGNRSLL